MNRVIENRTMETIKSRRSYRKYVPGQLKEEELNTILDAGMYAPSACNEQPWHFTVIQDKDLIDRINEETKKELVKSGSERFAERAKDPDYHIFYNCPTVIVISGREGCFSPMTDCAAASQNMLLAAESLDIGSCWIGLVGYYFRADMDRSKNELNIPAEYTPYYALCFGYKDKSKVFEAPERKPGVINYIRGF
jgi:nitroreductase